MPKWGKYKKSYRKEWETDPDLKTWITPVPGDDSKARCKYCNTEIRAQLNDLKEHGATKKHKSRCEPRVKSFAVPVVGSGGGAGTVKDDQKRRELRIATYVACHTSINAVQDLSDILQEEMMHRTTCTAIITSVLAPHFREELKEDVGESPYSLYLDETTDISVNKLLCICVKYRSQKHNKFVTTYLGLVDLLSADAQGISDAIVSFLSECGLDIKHMVGIATDDTSVMVGKHHSVFTLLKQKQPSLQLIRCVCHSLDIVAHKAMQLLPSNVEYMIRETYNWFAHSAKRQSDYNSVYKTINDGGCPLKFISSSSTRWLMMSDCIERILEQEDALKLHFGLVSSAEHCYAARLLNDMYTDKSNSLYMHFLQPVLIEIKTDADLGSSFQQQLEASTLAPELKDRISVSCFDFLKEVLVQYQMHLPESMEMLRKLELFCPKLVMSSVNRPGVKDLPAEFFSCSVDALESQWRNIASAGFSSGQAIDAFWLEVEAFQDARGNQCFKDLALGVIRLLTLPISIAHVKRAFSQVTLLKDDTRNRMGLRLLSSLMDVSSGLSRNGLTSATFKPPRQLLGRVKSQTSSNQAPPLGLSTSVDGGPLLTTTDSPQNQARHYKVLQELYKSRPNKKDVAQLLDLEYQARFFYLSFCGG
ncbi:hypothetical protein D5F01_LYC22285 [Larimichthys crocea]|uniref:Uncharacterized protein n=1 Tax=Larimichthys crocea TaxID=215358 RepID=A0A6G0HM35_LARCR|nr:hypothetical protein D5F01_LYC22285 [Larimichthys crocea]